MKYSSLVIKTIKVIKHNNKQILQFDKVFTNFLTLEMKNHFYNLYRNSCTCMTIDCLEKTIHSDNLNGQKDN